MRKATIGQAVAAVAVTLAIPAQAEAYPPPGNLSAAAEAHVVGTQGGVYWRSAPQENA